MGRLRTELYVEWVHFGQDAMQIDPLCGLSGLVSSLKSANPQLDITHFQEMPRCLCVSRNRQRTPMRTVNRSKEEANTPRVAPKWTNDAILQKMRSFNQRDLAYKQPFSTLS